MNEKTLYVSDLDGTLLGSDNLVPPNALQLLNGLIQKGVYFTYATARSYTSARKVTEGLKLTLPVITYNGTFLVDSQTGEPTSRQVFSQEERIFLKALTSAAGLSPFVYSFVQNQERVSYRDSSSNRGMKEYYLASRKGDKRFRAVEKEETLYEGEIFYITCIDTRENLLPLWERIKDDERFTVFFQQELYRSEYWLEIMPSGASKAKGALELKQKLGCTYLVVFGDGVNDLNLFQAADEAYATANAEESLKAAATAVIGSCNEGAVAQWIARRENF